MKVGFKVQTKIKKPVTEVFQAVVKPEILNKYFTMAAQGELKAGTTVFWNWSDMQKGLEVKVKSVIENEKIELTWNSIAGYDTNIIFTFKPLEGNSTLLMIEESGWNADQKSLDASYDHCSGWEHMANCLKAYLQYGIDLRQ
jgi:uncharacterized protein YndB with AHSA1/START domain